MKRVTTLAPSALIITGLLVGGNAAAAAQDPPARPTELAAACEANAPDEAILGERLVIVHSVLERSSPAATLTPTSDFNDDLGAVIGGVTLLDGKWMPIDTAAGRTLKTDRKWDARRARKVAGRLAHGLRIRLLATTPDSCSLTAYARAWDLATSFRAYEHGDEGAAKRIGQDMTALFASRSGAQDCAAAEGQPGALKVEAADDAFHRLLGKRLIDYRRRPGGALLTLTSKGERYGDSEDVPDTIESEAGRDFLISLWAAYERATRS